jgi:uncharacterized protein (TIGR03435 family)
MFSASHAFGQPTAHGPQFEVASIKPNKSEDRRMLIGPTRGGRFSATNTPLQILIMQAYSMKGFQLSGAPNWLMSERYDIEAKADGNPSMNEMLPMIQALLEDRMQLKYHRETKEMPIYALMAGKPGKLVESPGECGPRAPAPPPARGQLPPVPCGQLSLYNGHLRGEKVTIAQLIDPLARLLDRAVSDQTGLAGKYNIHLEFAQERRQPLAPANSSDGPQPPQDDPTGPSLLEALKEQLGLKLESSKGPVEIMVIDHVERPSEN